MIYRSGQCRRVDGNPASMAEDKIQVPAVGTPTEPAPEPDFEAD